MSDTANPFERLRRVCLLLIKDDEKDVGKGTSKSLGFRHPHHYLIGMMGYVVSYPLEGFLMKYLPPELREAIETEGKAK